MKAITPALCVLALLPSVQAARLQWKAGAAKVRINPREPVWMGGYSARTRPMEGVAQDLYATALALEDQTGARSVLVTVDLLRITGKLSDAVAADVERKLGIPRARLLFNASHTHAGPVFGGMPDIFYPDTPELLAAEDRYAADLERELTEAIDTALKRLRPASLRFGRTEVAFARNRRSQVPNGPVDHDVPVLRVDDRRGRPVAIVFGYACHNTTIGPEVCKLHGDYAGSAKAALETENRGAIALFVAGCGADANPEPRGSIELAEEHGATLAKAVEQRLRGELRPVAGPLRAAFTEVALEYAPSGDRAEWAAKADDADAQVRRHARKMVEIIDRDGRLPASHACPLQVWRFGQDLTLVAIGGEVVVDYDLRLKKELGGDKLWVAGYSNDVFDYVPSLRVLKEGGYEGGGASVYHVDPGPFAPTIEETIIGGVHALLEKTNGNLN
jgi:neutral ceramidase